VESVPCWFYGLIILQEQFYAKREFPRATQDFKSGTGISYVSITFRDRQGNFPDNLQMGLICSAGKKVFKRIYVLKNQRMLFLISVR